MKELALSSAERACPRGGMTYATDLKQMEGLKLKPKAIVPNGTIQAGRCNDVARKGCMDHTRDAYPAPGRSLQTDCQMTDTCHAALRKPHARRHTHDIPQPKT